MTYVHDWLREGDPVRHEPGLDDAVRSRLRASVLARGGRAPVAPRRRAAQQALAALVVMLGVGGAGAWLWRAANPVVHAAVRFEVRLAEVGPGVGLREAAVGTEPRVVYLHDEVVVTNDDIVAADVVAAPAGDRFAVAVRLSPVGSDRLRAATRRHMGRPVALLLDGLVLMAPTVRSEIGDVGLLTGDFDRPAAERIARGLTAR